MLGLLLGVAVAAQVDTTGGNWAPLFRAEAHTAYIDLASIRPRGDLRSVRTRIEYDEPLESGSFIAYYEQDVDCRARSLSLTAYSTFDRQGRRLREGVVEEGERQQSRILPDTQGAALFTEVCGEAFGAGSVT